MKKDPKNNWIKLNRAIMNDWIWTEGNDEPFDKRSAWIDLIMLAYDKDTSKIYNGSIVEVKRGQVPYSKEWLANRWHWSRGKVDRFLKALEKDKKCTTNSTTHGTTITIENYAKWQGGRATNRQGNGTTDGQQTERPADTDKELIEELKEEGAFAPPSAASVFSFFESNGFVSDPEQFYSWYEGNGWTKKNGDPVKDWKSLARQWEKREKRYIEERSAKGASKAPPQPEPPKYPEFEKAQDRKGEAMTEEQRLRMEETKRRLAEAFA